MNFIFETFLNLRHFPSNIHIYVTAYLDIEETYDTLSFYEASQAVFWRWSIEKVFLEISQNSQENNCARISFLIKLQV